MDRRLTTLENEASVYAPIEVVVVGSGYSGVELSATLAERLGQKGTVKVIDMASDIVASAPAGTREAASRVNFHETFSCIWSFVVSLCNL